MLTASTGPDFMRMDVVSTFHPTFFWAGAQAAAAASVKQKQPLSRVEQLDEANKASMRVWVAVQEL